MDKTRIEPIRIPEWFKDHKGEWVASKPFRQVLIASHEDSEVLLKILKGMENGSNAVIEYVRSDDEPNFSGWTSLHG